MRAISSPYSEAEGKLNREESFYKSLTGATASSGIEREPSNLPSLSMTDFPEAAPVVIISPERTFWLWRQAERSEWTGLYTVPRLPDKLREQLQILHREEREDGLYKIADAIADWMIDASGAEQSVFATYIGGLTARSARILFSAIADAEVQVASERLLHTIAGFLGSEDKRLAQTAAVCLLQCGGGLGGTLLRARLNSPASLPHIQLILGAVNLLSSK
jgi:hypothetical protein